MNREIEINNFIKDNQLLFINYKFNNLDLLYKAITHTSIINSNNVMRSESYERLEFLGDRVLGLIIANMLYDNFPNASEGELSRRFNYMVRKETCAKIALQIGLNKIMRISKSEEQTGGRKKTTLLADMCEAIIAAIYLDGGFKEATKFVNDCWYNYLFGGHITSQYRDAKTALQEWAQSLGLPIPEYSIISKIGPDHEPYFVIRVFIKDIKYEQGSGRSKKEAEQNAAKAILLREGVWDINKN